MEQTVIYLLMVQKFINLKQNIRNCSSSIWPGNISKDWIVDNMKRKGLNGNVYGFSANFDAIAVNDILDLHKYLMKKNCMI